MNWKYTMECKGTQKGLEGSTSVLRDGYELKGSHRIKMGSKGS